MNNRNFNVLVNDDDEAFASRETMILRKLFASHDENGDGKLSLRELNKCLEELDMLSEDDHSLFIQLLVTPEYPSSQLLYSWNSLFSFAQFMNIYMLYELCCSRSKQKTANLLLQHQDRLSAVRIPNTVRASPSHEYRQAYFSRDDTKLDPYNDFTPSQMEDYMTSESITYSPSELSLIKKSFLSFDSNGTIPSYQVFTALSKYSIPAISHIKEIMGQDITWDSFFKGISQLDRYINRLPIVAKPNLALYGELDMATPEVIATPRMQSPTTTPIRSPYSSPRPNTVSSFSPISPYSPRLTSFDLLSPTVRRSTPNNTSIVYNRRTRSVDDVMDASRFVSSKVSEATRINDEITRQCAIREEALFTGNISMQHQTEATLSQLRAKRKESERIFQEYSLKPISLQSRDSTIRIIEEGITSAIQEKFSENSEKIRSSYEQKFQEIRSIQNQEIMKNKQEVDRLNRRIIELERELKNVVEGMKNLEEENSSMRVENATLRSKNSFLNNKVEDLNVEMEELRRMQEMYEEEKRTLEDELYRLQEELKRKDEGLQAHRNKAKELEDYKNQNQSNYAIVKKNLDEEVIKNANLKNENELIRKQLEDAKFHFQQQKINSEEYIKVLQERHAAEMKQYADRITALESQLSRQKEKNATIANTQRNMDNLSAQLSEYEQRIRDEQSRANRLAGEKSSADQTVTKLEKTVLQLHSLLLEAEDRAGRLVEENEGLHMQLEEMAKAKSPAVVTRSRTMTEGSKKTVINKAKS